ncbi:MAG TPA: hypothetical protein VGY56_11910 [Verrucomicrobiae bacterium]|nr:hypothetical protein [Verrucomicrobiae bacterium]
MKSIKRPVIVAALIVAIGLVTYAEDLSTPKNTDGITGSINFVNFPVHRVLDVYKVLAKAELIVASNVRDTGITLQATAVPSGTAQHLIEEALLKQATNHLNITWSEKPVSRHTTAAPPKNVAPGSNTEGFSSAESGKTPKVESYQDLANAPTALLAVRWQC